jgi:hypothetical protein
MRSSSDPPPEISQPRTSVRLPDDSQSSCAGKPPDGVRDTLDPALRWNCRFGAKRPAYPQLIGSLGQITLKVLQRLTEAAIDRDRVTPKSSDFRLLASEPKAFRNSGSKI